jgi:hypothetical protein
VRATVSGILIGAYVLVAIGFFAGGLKRDTKMEAFGFAIASAMWPLIALVSFGEDLVIHIDQKWGKK